MDKTEAPEFKFFTTDDGSPTLTVAGSEKMHSEGGAYSETAYVYGRSMDFIRSKGLPRKFLCVGLGLGYVEILLGAKFFKEQVEIESFEANTELRNYFWDWLGDRFQSIPPDFKRAYDEILYFTARNNELDPSELKIFLQTIKSRSWNLNGPLTPSTLSADHGPINRGPFHGIFYDAFSSQTNPELWTAEFLEQFLHKSAAIPCVFSTYAATSILKKTLKTLGFELHHTPGFKGKRECVFATR